MKHISFSALIITLISLGSVEAMELSTKRKVALVTIEQGNMIFTDAYWEQRRIAQKEASERLVTHRQNEYNFKRLLAAEEKEPQETRWEKIKPLLMYVGAYLSINRSLRKELFNCICDQVDEDSQTVHHQDITYDTWLKIINPPAYQARSLQYEVPPLPPLPDTCLALPTIESLTLPPLPDIVVEESITCNTEHKEPAEALSIDEGPLMATEPATVPKQTDIATDAKVTSAPKKRKNVRTQQQTAPNKKSPVKPRRVIIKNEPVLTQREVAHNAFWLAFLSKNVAEVKSICASEKIDLNISRPGEKTNPPLLTCVIENLLEMAACLLELGANPNTQAALKLPGKKGWLKTTPLSYALQSTKIDFIELLLKHQANPDIHAEWIPSRKIEFPLNTAIAKKTKDDSDYKSRKTIAKLLLAHGVTKFFGKVILWDTDSNIAKSLDLAKQGTYIQELMTRVVKLQIKDNTITIHAKK